MAAHSVWNSLEIAKLMVAMLTPASVALLGWWLGRRSAAVEKARSEAERERQEERSQADRARGEAIARYSKVVEKRVALWDRLGPMLNQVYCFIREVGNWQVLSAAQVLALKRDADQLFFSNRPFFTDAFARDYDAFMESSFRTFNAIGTPAMIRTSAANHVDPDKDRLFTGEQRASQVHQDYFKLLNRVASELDVAVSTPAFREPQSEARQAAHS